MKTLSNQQLIISLIKDDMINTRLVNGLNAMGLNADGYLLHLGDTVFKLMGLNTHAQNEALTQHYMELLKKAESIELTHSHTPLNELAHEIYSELCNALTPYRESIDNGFFNK